MPDDPFESRVLHFEQGWRLRGRSEIDDYLGEPFARASPGRDRLLAELICVDLEFRWRNGRVETPATLEVYVERFPELVSLDRLPLELVGEEYRARRRWGDRPSHAEFLSRFRERTEAVRGELLRVDAEMDAESAGPAPPARPPATPTPGPADPDSPWLSDRDFLLRRWVGAGRTGKVYEARQRGGGPDVAVKFLRKTFLPDPAVVRRFVGEARTVALLRHDHIVGTRGLGRTRGGSYFLVNDLVDGPDLARLAAERVVTEGEAVCWAMQLCEALGHAHERGVVHCDLKPANLLIDGSGRIRVTDFGLARSLHADTPGAAEVEGTAPFMAPEQVSRSWGSIDHRTDVYGVGAVLFALLTGRPPFAGRRLPDVLAAVVSRTPVVPPDRLRPGLSGSLNDLCRKCLSKHKEARYPTVREVRADLARVAPS